MRHFHNLKLDKILKLSPLAMRAGVGCARAKCKPGAAELPKPPTSRKTERCICGRVASVCRTKSKRNGLCGCGDVRC